MASGILFITFAPGYPPDMTSYLFGDILTVSRIDILLTLILDIFVLFLVISAYEYLGHTCLMRNLLQCLK